MGILKKKKKKIPRLREVNFEVMQILRGNVLVIGILCCKTKKKKSQIIELLFETVNEGLKKKTSNQRRGKTKHFS